ncbi:cytochrome P450 2 sub U member 1 [Bulinus truncatus]|nr:cytochrome P450 2 sub U member 1 [Bulinus truncatus]
MQGGGMREVSKMIASLVTDVCTPFCLAIIAAATLLFLLIQRRPKNLPPSPGLALPFFGHLYMLQKNPRKQFRKWAEELGDVYTLQMGQQRAVFINSFEAMKEAFVKKADFFSDRIENLFIAKHSPDFLKGITFSSGANWKSQRTTSLSILRNFGMDKNLLAEKIGEEVSFFTKALAETNGEHSEIRYLTNTSVSNVISSIIFGQRFLFDDPKFIEMMGLLNEAVKLNSGANILNFAPFLFYLPFDLFGGQRMVRVVSDIRKFTSEMVCNIRKSHDPDNLDKYIVAYVDEMKREHQSGQVSYLDDVNLGRNIDALFIAGSETTSSTILWCLLYVLNYPDVQRKIYSEILEHIGAERSPSIADKPKKKFLTAFIMEVQRTASIVPLSLPHKCNTDTTVSGYTIPKGSLVMPNLDAVLKSKEIWGDPEKFRPERFLDERGNVLKREELIPFSIGRRACLGESLARMELFLFLSDLFQRFEFLPASSDKVPPLSETFGGVAAPEKFEIRCVERRK